jgi:hypothetical protein
MNRLPGANLVLVGERSEQDQLNCPQKGFNRSCDKSYAMVWDNVKSDRIVAVLQRAIASRGLEDVWVVASSS